jgi:TolB-like protein/DNA-binding winged helix-turn-helix (wHTH) protein/Tfp pilus assembly protein PilF
MSELQYRFAEFQLDCASFELRRQGRAQKSERISLERIPMELLILLLERQGSVVTRQEIVDRLWGKDVFVDTEHGINTAIRKVRQALRDNPDHPRFVQTVSGKGYRFVAETNGRLETPELVERRAPRPLESPEPLGEQPPRKPALSEVERSGGAEGSRRPGAIENSAPGPTSTKTKMIVAVAICLAAATALIFFLVRARLFPSAQAAQIHSLAVLPLANLSGDPSQDYFADGMTDELITALAKNRNLRVVSRTSAMQYKGVKRPLADIARELGVDGILEGSIERAPDNVHMTVQLIYAPTDTHVWAESYDRDLSQAYSLPEELSRTIAKEVRGATSPAPAPRYISPEAHDAYLHGRYFWFTFNVSNTLPYFEKAIQLQPDYAAAWSGLADTYAVDGMQNRLSSEVSEKAHAAALKALELDPLLGEAHNSLSAWYLFYAWDPARAEVEARRAIELDPNYAEGHHLFSYILEVEHRYEEGEVEAKRAVELDPFMHPWELGAFYVSTRQYDKAMKELSMQRVARPNDSDIALALSNLYWLKSMYKESQAEYERALDLTHDSATKAASHHAWITGGETAVERWGAANLKALARKHYIETEFVASVIAFTGDKEETLKYLELSYRNHDPDLIFIQNEPHFNFVHSDPRYQALVKKIGLQLVP